MARTCSLDRVCSLGLAMRVCVGVAGISSPDPADQTDDNAVGSCESRRLERHIARRFMTDR